MTPEVEIARLQERVRALEGEIERLATMVGELGKVLRSVDADAKRMRFGLAVLAGIGGAVAWILSIADKIVGWMR